MVGRTEILGLREQARSVLGSRFDIRAFHDCVLEDGSVPLGFLRLKIERWVEKRRPKALRDPEGRHGPRVRWPPVHRGVWNVVSLAGSRSPMQPVSTTRSW